MIIADLLVVVAVIICLLIFTAALSWLFLGIPSVPTPRAVVSAMIELADIKEGETVFDLGAGDGRVLIEAVEQHPTIHAVGCELNPVIWFFGKIRILFARVHVTFHLHSIFSEDLLHADVIFLYLFPNLMQKLESKFSRELRPGTRIVSYMFRFPDREPIATKKVKGYWGESSVYLYRW